MAQYLASASHIKPMYRADDLPIHVYQDANSALWRAWAVHYGCSSEHSSPAIAIAELLRDNGCTDISVKIIEGPTGQDLRRALAVGRPDAVAIHDYQIDRARAGRMRDD
jgi:hypothetical protein